MNASPQYSNTDKENRPGLVQRLGKAVARVHNARDMNWVDGLSADMRAMVHEYDIGPVQLAIRAGCTDSASVGIICRVMRQRGMLHKGLNIAVVRGLAGRLAVGKYTSTRKTERAIRRELLSIDTACKACEKIPEQDASEIRKILLGRMRLLYEDLLKIRKSERPD